MEFLIWDFYCNLLTYFEFLCRTKISTLCEDLRNFVTFHLYDLITENIYVLVSVQAEVEERDDD